jgi:hypothetical protein
LSTGQTRDPRRPLAIRAAQLSPQRSKIADTVCPPARHPIRRDDIERRPGGAVGGPLGVIPGAGRFRQAGDVVVVDLVAVSRGKQGCRGIDLRDTEAHVLISVLCGGRAPRSRIHRLP